MVVQCRQNGRQKRLLEQISCEQLFLQDVPHRFGRFIMTISRVSWAILKKKKHHCGCTKWRHFHHAHQHRCVFWYIHLALYSGRILDIARCLLRFDGGALTASSTRRNAFTAAFQRVVRNRCFSYQVFLSHSVRTKTNEANSVGRIRRVRHGLNDHEQRVTNGDAIRGGTGGDCACARARSRARVRRCVSLFLEWHESHVGGPRCAPHQDDGGGRRRVTEEMLRTGRAGGRSSERRREIITRPQWRSGVGGTRVTTRTHTDSRARHAAAAANTYGVNTQCCYDNNLGQYHHDEISTISQDNIILLSSLITEKW